MHAAGTEFWIESDSDIDEDVVFANVAPMDLMDTNEQDEELSFIVRWIVLLLAIFQTRFFLTNRALLSFLGKYSPKLAQIAALLPKSLYKHNISLTDHIQDTTFERRVVCNSCDSLYTFDSCLHKVGSTTIAINRCLYKPYNKRCNTALMKEIITASGLTLQALVRRSGFIEQCE